MDAQKKLFRPKKNRIIAGVCAGLAQYYAIDVWIVRLIFLTLLLADGIAAIIYIILIFVIPEEPAENVAEVITSTDKPATAWMANRRNVFAFMLIGLGIIFLLKQIFPWPWFNMHLFWPLVVVAAGIWLIIKK